MPYGKEMRKTVKETNLSLEKQKQILAEQFWLLYYNQTLFERGLITEQERNRMANRISNRKTGSG